MDQSKMTKYFIDLNRNAFNNWFVAVSLSQDQAERMVNMVFDQAAWLPSEGRRAIKDWVSISRKAQETCRTLIHNGFNRTENLFFEG